MTMAFNSTISPIDINQAGLGRTGSLAVVGIVVVKYLQNFSKQYHVIANLDDLVCHVSTMQSEGCHQLAFLVSRLQNRRQSTRWCCPDRVGEEGKTLNLTVFIMER